MPQYPIDPRRSALILFDMLEHYLAPSDPERAQRIAASRVVENAARVLAAARAAGMAVFYTNADHRADGRDWIATIVDTDTDLQPWPDGTRPAPLPPVARHPDRARVVAALAPRPEELVVPKHRWSAFAGTHLDLLLRARAIDTLLLSGVSTDVGIASTAYAARDLGYHLIILRDCCYTERAGAQEFFMSRVFPRLARVLDADAAIALIGAPGSSERAVGG
jgi:ureidoacrylate peracid hydrolase